MRGDPKPYVITYKHNRTGELIETTTWAYSIKDARERFRDSDEREVAQKIVSVQEAEKDAGK